MATRKKPGEGSSRAPGGESQPNELSLRDGNNPLARIDDGLEPRQHRPSEELIYESMMRGGGEPFGSPFEVGVPTLTERVVKYFKQKGFFAFETFEKSRPKRRRNRFTRYGASRYFGELDVLAAKRRAERAEKAGAKGKGKGGSKP